MARPKIFNRLTDKETEVMTILWQHGPQTVREILSYYDEPRPHFNTISTIVRILEDKGFVAHNDGGSAFSYYATADMNDFRERSFARLVKNYFNNSYAKAVSSLVAEGKISVEELREIIETVEKDRQE